MKRLDNRPRNRYELFLHDLYIDQEKQKLSQLEQKYESLSSDNAEEKERFLKFALERADNMSRYFTELSKDRILKCKQLLFPADFGSIQRKCLHSRNEHTLQISE